MIKVLIKYLLSLCILLLLSGYSQLPALTPNDTFSPQFINSEALVRIKVEKSLGLIIKAAFPSTHKENGKLDIAENKVEEEELCSSKKQGEHGGFLGLLYYTLVPQYFSNCITNSLAFKYFSYITPHERHLIFCVIRI